MKDLYDSNKIAQELLESEERFRATFEQAAVGIAHLAPDGHWLLVNQRLCDIVGYSRAELLELTFQDITYVDDLEADLAFVQQMLLNQRQNYSMEKRYIHKNGLLVWINLTVSLVRDKDGTPKYFISVVEDISIRKQAENQIRELAKLHPYPVLRLRADGLLLYANDSSNWLLEEWKCNIGDYAPEMWRQVVSETLRNNAAQKFDFKHSNKIWTFLAVAIQEESYVNLYGQDITEQTQLIKKNAELAAIVDFSKDAIVGKTLDGIITTWNKGAEQIYGYPEREVIGNSVSILTAPGYEDDMVQVLKKIKNGEHVENYETIRKRKDGQLIHVALSVSPILDQSGQVVSVSAISQDITERYESHEELHRYAERLAAINRLDRVISSGIEINQIYDNFVKELHTYFKMDRSGIALLNETGDQYQIVQLWTAYTPLFVQGNWFPVQGSAMEYLVEHRTLFFEREVGEKGDWPETALLKHEGIRSRWLFPLIIEEKVIGLLSVSFLQPAALSEEDQTILEAIADQLAIAIQNARLYEQIRLYSVELEQRVLERTADLETTNKELEAFSYSVSHDLRAPLRAMDGFSRILMDDYSSVLPDQAKRYLGLVRENAQQMGKLIDHLLTFSRLGRQALTKELLDPAKLALAVMADLLAPLTDRQIDVIIPDLPSCEADPFLLRQVFANLLGNAIKFTKKREETRIEVGHFEQNGVTVYFVKDNGAGFDMQYVGKLFGVFQRLHLAEDYEGTGVGLANVQRIIHRHGGRIWTEGVLNQGATFYFTLERENSDEK